MTEGLFVNPNTFVSFSELQNSVLSNEVATRQNRYNEVSTFFNYLPDPDPILRKLGKDVTVYRDLLSDSHVGSVVEQRQMSVTTFEWQVVRDEATAKEADFIEDVFKDFDIDNLINQILNSVLFGLTILESVWIKSGKYFIPEKIEEKPLEWFGFDDKNQLMFFRDSVIDGEVIIGKDAKPEHNYKWILIQNKATYQNPYGDRALSRCFWPVAFKRGGMKFWVKMVEKFGSPWVVGKQPRGAGDEASDRMLDQLVAMIQDAVAVIPDDSSVEIIESKGQASSNLYEAFRQANNDEISKAIVTQTLTTELSGKTGSFAASKTHEGQLVKLSVSDKKKVQRALNQVVKYLIDLNFGSGNYPTFDIYEEEDVNKELAERDGSLVNQGVKFTKKYYANAYNLKEDEFEVKESPDPDNTNVETQFIASQKNNINNEPTGSELSEATENAFKELIENSIPEGVLQLQAEQTLKPVIEFINNTNDFDTAFNQLSEAYPEMKTNQLEELLQKLIFISEIEGRISAQNENL